MNEERGEKRTILVLCAPAYGHLNPICSLTNELAKRTKNVKVIFFGNAEHRGLIEKSGADFRLCNVVVLDPTKSVNDMEKNLSLFDMMQRYMNVADEMIPQYLKVIEEEHVDLVIHDFGAIWARWMIEHMDYLYTSKQMTRKPPKSIMVSASILFDHQIYPNESELKFLPKPAMSVGMVIGMAPFMFKYWRFYRKYGLKFASPMEFLIFSRDKANNLCCVTPEFHPRSHLFDKSVKFIGNFASEDLREAKSLEDPLKTFLEPFEPKNPLPLTANLALAEETVEQFNRQPKLIYASFGTLANQDMAPYLQIIGAVKNFDQEKTKSGITGSQIKLLLSVGKKSYATFQTMIQNKEIQIPDNVLILDQVPQLDVLKRASLFITHSGQGSTSEAIHYGVPMVCVPIVADQPLVAYRVADELGLGVRIAYKELDSAKVRRAIVQIFDDKEFLERSLVYAQLSAKHDGLKKGTDIIMQLLQDPYQ